MPDVLSGLSPCLNALIAYVARDWRLQCYIIGTLNAFALLICWFLPKSKEWLAAQESGNGKAVDKWDQVKQVIKGNATQFKLIIGSSSILRASLIMVS